MAMHGGGNVSLAIAIALRSGSDMNRIGVVVSEASRTLFSSL